MKINNLFRKTFSLFLMLIFLFLTTLNCENESGQSDVTDGLVARYQFNGDATDAVGDADGTVSGADLTAEDRFGDPNSACSFDGTDDVITIGSITMEPCQGFSFSMWIRSQNTGYVVYSYPFFFYENSVFCVWPGSTNSGTCSVTADTWTHVAGSYNEDTHMIRVYVNGDFIDDADKGDSISSNISNLEIGMRSGVGNYWQGTIDGLRIYNRVLSDNEVSIIFQNDTD